MNMLIASFLNRKLIDEVVIRNVGDELMALAEEINDHHIVLNLQEVDFISSVALGKLIQINKKVGEANTRYKLWLVEIKIEIFTAFKITNLTDLMNIRATIEDVTREINQTN